MIWPTLLKDVRLLWPLALLTAALQAFTTWLSVRGYLSSGPPSIMLPGFVNQSLIVPMLAVALLCALLVRQDPPQGERNDWLTRPAPRGRMALTKITTALLLIHLPMVVIDFGYGLVLGIEPAPAAFASVLRSLYTFCLISLPALGAASLAGTLGQAIVGSVAVATVLWFLDSISGRYAGFANFYGLPPGVSAMAALPLGAGVMGALALALQFPMRRRIVAAAAAAPFAVVCLATFDPSWFEAFGLKSATAARERPETKAFTITFDAARGPFNHNGDGAAWALRTSQQIDDMAGKEKVAFLRRFPQAPGEPSAFVFLPMRSAGTPPGQVWLTSEPTYVLRDASGAQLARLHAPYDQPLSQRRDGGGPSSAGYVYGYPLTADATDRMGATLELPKALLSEFGDKPVSIDMTFEIVFLRKTREAPVVAGDQALAGFGVCRVGPPTPNGRTYWSVGCLHPRTAPYCTVLQTAAGDGIPACSPLYRPVYLAEMMRGPYPRSPQGGALAAGPDAKMVLQDWEPAGRAMRTVRIEGIKLNDWTSAANELPPR